MASRHSIARPLSIVVFSAPWYNQYMNPKSVVIRTMGIGLAGILVAGPWAVLPFDKTSKEFDYHPHEASLQIGTAFAAGTSTTELFLS